MTQVFLEANSIQPSTDVPHLSLLYEPWEQHVRPLPHLLRSPDPVPGLLSPGLQRAALLEVQQVQHRQPGEGKVWPQAADGQLSGLSPDTEGCQQVLASNALLKALTSEIIII